MQAKEKYQDRIKEDTPIEAMHISTRSMKCLKRLGMETVSDFFDYDSEKLPRVRNFGMKSLMDVITNGLKPLAEDNDWRLRALKAESLNRELVKEFEELLDVLDEMEFLTAPGLRKLLAKAKEAQ